VIQKSTCISIMDDWPAISDHLHLQNGC